jgi:transcriptional regulator with XRE-family HTH domain
MSEQDQNRQRIVREAAGLMGHRELAGRMGVSMGDVSSWIDGTAFVPDAVLVQLSEILVAWSGNQKFK